MKNIDKILKQARISKGLTQSELASMLGISNRAVSKWENGLSKPSMSNYIKLTEFLELPSFFNGRKSLPKSPLYMSSITELYKIGRGPSSSHTIGPEQACIIFKKENPKADLIKVILYGSLSKTGKGHGTDSVIKKTLSPIKTRIIFNDGKINLPHPNTMDLIAYKSGREIGKVRVLSIGGGYIKYGNRQLNENFIYSETKFSDISDYCKKRCIKLWEYIEEKEHKNYKNHLYKVWETMKASIQRGLKDEGILPGGLNVQKKANFLYNSRHIDETPQTKENRLICAYAFAVSEQNASGETIATAPTCGAAGVLPAVLLYEQQKHNFSDEEIIKALSVAGLIGNLIKHNASISGAECGCQAEIGSACAMASAALATLFDLEIDKIEYAAEIALEHHLGLTCDPICGLVQIPCIERNAVAAMRAINAVNLSGLLWNTRKISFDSVVATMLETGKDLSYKYKETSEGGLAYICKNNITQF